MAEQSILFQEGSLQIVVQKAVEIQAINLLQDAVYGTAGIRYQQTGQEIKLYDLYDPFFYYLYQEQQLIGMYCLDRRSLKLTDATIDKQEVIAFYGRYLAVANTQGGQGYGSLLKKVAISHIDQMYRDEPIHYLFYSYIEDKNKRSVTISRKNGFESVAKLKTFFFRRYAPVKNNHFQPLPADQLTDIRLRLSAYYSKYTFQSLDRIGYQNNYFVMKEQGQIVAGVQANPIRWIFKEMPGFRGWIFMNILPRLRVARRLFNPEPFQFVVLEGIYLQHNRADILPILLESVLAHFEVNSAMWQIDENDPHVADLKQANMGLLSGFEKGVNTHVMTKMGASMNLHNSNQAPHYISCFDYA